MVVFKSQVLLFSVGVEDCPGCHNRLETDEAEGLVGKGRQCYTCPVAAVSKVSFLRQLYNGSSLPVIGHLLFVTDCTLFPFLLLSASPQICLPLLEPYLALVCKCRL